MKWGPLVSSCGDARRRQPARFREMDRHRRADHADVAERLRVVAEHLARLGIDLLGEQAEIVGAPEHHLEALLRLLDLPAPRERATSQSVQNTNVPSSPASPSPVPR